MPAPPPRDRRSRARPRRRRRCRCPANRRATRRRAPASRPRRRARRRENRPKPEPPSQSRADGAAEDRRRDTRRRPRCRPRRRGAEGEVERGDSRDAARAQRRSEPVDYRALNADARTQYDTAKRFIQQAEDAMRRARTWCSRKNLADKAAALAAQLRAGSASPPHDIRTIRRPRSGHSCTVMHRCQHLATAPKRKAQYVVFTRLTNAVEPAAHIGRAVSANRRATRESSQLLAMCARISSGPTQSCISRTSRVTRIQLHQ